MVLHCMHNYVYHYDSVHMLNEVKLVLRLGRPLAQRVTIKVAVCSIYVCMCACSHVYVYVQYVRHS